MRLLKLPKLAAMSLTAISLCLAAAGQDASEPEEAPVPIDESALTDEEKARLAVARQFLERLRAGEFETAAGMFSEELGVQLNAEFAEHSWSELLKAKGEYVSEMVTKINTDGDRFRAELLVSFDEGDLEIRIQVNAAHEISAMQLFLDAAPEYVDLTTEFFELLEKEEFEEAIGMCDEIVKGILTPEALKGFVEELEKTFGKPLEFKPFQYVPIPGYYSVLAPWVFERGEVIINLTFNAQKQIAGYAVIPVSQIDLEKAVEEADAAQE